MYEQALVEPRRRSIRVPAEYAGGEAAAAYIDGVLEILLRPRRKRVVGSIHIEIMEGR